MATVSVNTLEESHPVFSGEPTYLDGYVPSSFDSPHSSLQRSATWIGMGFVLSALAGLGTFVFGLGSASVGSQENAHFFTILGAVLALIFVVVGFALIHVGRAGYREYVARTGRKH